MNYQYFLHVILKCIQNNIEYLIRNTIHQAIQIYHSMLVLKFIFIVLAFYVFPCDISTKI